MRRVSIIIVIALLGSYLINHIASCNKLNYAIASKENVNLHVQAHIICYNSILAGWAESDSTYIPLDSLNEVYLRHCGAFIDSIKQGN